MAGRGLVIVYTGDGKGKTTAALGVLFRAWGHRQRVIVLQFIKSGRPPAGEHEAADRLGIEVAALGDGFTWLSKDIEQTASLATDAWERAKATIVGGEYDVVVLDELTYPLQYLWVPVQEVIETLRARPAHVHVVITGRGAPAELIEAADLVTEMRLIKHPYREQGIPAQKGIDF
ncbi:MAG TPA: cob(I)yrinic acid a,c-diamide adenosyltransferase [Tepidiformaceae bacterium]|jgi:cob(I)alamin adenosyltransferase